MSKGKARTVFLNSRMMDGMLLYSAGLDANLWRRAQMGIAMMQFDKERVDSSAKGGNAMDLVLDLDAGFKNAKKALKALPSLPITKGRKGSPAKIASPIKVAESIVFSDTMKTHEIFVASVGGGRPTVTSIYNDFEPYCRVIANAIADAYGLRSVYIPRQQRGNARDLIYEMEKV